MSKTYLMHVGDIIELSPGMTVYAMLPEHCCFDNRFGVFNQYHHHEMKIGSQMKGLDTHQFAGQYEVIQVSQDGGGSQTGMNGHPDTWPDGHHVRARMIREKCLPSDPYFEVDFYQTGCFTAMIPPEEAIIIKKAKP